MNECIGSLLFLILVLELCSTAAVAGADLSASTSSSVRSNDPVVARVGDHVTLQCSVQSEEEGDETCLGWTYYPPSFDSVSQDDLELNDCYGVYDTRNGRIAAEPEGTDSVLNITDLQSGDAGRYKCQNVNSEEEATFSNELIVIDDHPRCSSTSHKHFDNKITNDSANQRGHNMELHCEVGFTSSPNAIRGQCILEWRIVGRKDVLNSTCIVGENSVKATLTLDAASHSNITSYVCVVRGEKYSCETGQIETPLTTQAAHVGLRDWIGISSTNGSESKAAEDISTETNLPLDNVSVNRSHANAMSSSTAKSQWPSFSFLVLFVLFL